MDWWGFSILLRPRCDITLEVKHRRTTSIRDGKMAADAVGMGGCSSSNKQFIVSGSEWMVQAKITNVI